VSFDRSEVATPYGACSFFKISILCRIFRFLRLSVDSLVSGGGLLDFPQLLS
jgi:hypothetical protein